MPKVNLIPASKQTSKRHLSGIIMTSLTEFVCTITEKKFPLRQKPFSKVVFQKRILAQTVNKFLTLHYHIHNVVTSAYPEPAEPSRRHHVTAVHFSMHSGVFIVCQLNPVRISHVPQVSRKLRQSHPWFHRCDSITLFFISPYNAFGVTD